MFNQQASVEKLQRNIQEVINDRFPMEIKGGYEINVSNVRVSQPDSSLEAQERAYLTDSTFKMPIKVDINVTKNGEEVLSRKNVTFAQVPYPTERGSYIINGNENVIINQMILRPGVFVHPAKTLKDGTFLNAEVRSGRTRFVVSYHQDKGSLNIENLSLEFGKNPNKVQALPFLNLMGLTNDEIKAAIGDDDIYNAIRSNTTKTPQEVFNQLFSAEYKDEKEARDYLNEQMAARLTFDDKGKKVTQIMIGTSSDSVDKNVLLNTLKGMFKEEKNPGSSPNVDDIRFKNIYGPEDIIARTVDNGINQWKKNIITAIRFNKMNNPKAVFSPSGVVTKEVDKLYRSSLVEHVSSGNVLDLFQNQRKITFGAPEFGGLSIDSVTNASRSLQDSAFGKIDPIETPQSLALGYTQHLSKDVRVDNNTLYSSFYRVNNGVVDKSKVIDDIDPIDEYDMYVAFNSPKQLEVKDGVTKLKGTKIRARYQGDFIDVEPSKIQLIDKSSTSHIGNATALIPFGAHNDGARMLMGASMQRQALALEDPDEPLVQSVDKDTGETLEQVIADNSSYLLKSPTNGEVTEISDKEIVITDDSGKRIRVPKLNYHVNNKSGGFINHKPVVAVGDKVREGQLIADGWQSKNGKLALGKNTRVAFMPYKGLNFEDGVVVSQSFANKMASEELKVIEREVFYGQGNVPRKEVKQRLKELMVSPGILNKLDANGIIKKGTVIEKGDILIGSVIEKGNDNLSAAENILSRVIIQSARDSYADNSTKVEGYQKGRVVDVQTVENGDTTKVLIKLVSFKPMDKGDKLAGRHGNKGTITAVLPDNEMPHTEDGQPIELIFSPLAVPSRKNVGQLLEVNAGLIAEKKGMSSYNVKNFDDRMDKQIAKELEEIGAPDGKMTLIDPETGKPYENPVTVGPMYILKLKHKVEGKISNRNYIGAVDKMTDMPKKVSGATDGERRSPQGVGGMEFWSLTSAGAVNNIHEMTTLKSDGAGFNHDGSVKPLIYEALKRGTPMPKPATPQTLKVLQEQLYGAGLSITPLKDNDEVTLDEKFNSLMLSPLRKSDIARMSPKSVLNAKTYNSRTKDPDKKGLYGEDIFGKDGNQWGKIDLTSPIANPIFVKGDSSSRPYEAMLASKGLTQSDIVKFVAGGQYIVMDPKDSGFEKYQILTPDQVEEAEIMEDKEFDVMTGSTALHALLKDVNLKDELKNAENELKEINNTVKENPGKKTQAMLDRRDAAVKRIKLLGSAIDHKMEPTDYMLPFVPVLPVKYREPVQMNDNALAEDGITLLYQGLMKKQNEFEKAIKKYEGTGGEMDRDIRAELEAKIFEDLEYIVGTKTYEDKARGVEYKGIIERLAHKQGFIREKMQKKLQDYSGRSVIVGAPDLDLDEVRIPEDMAAEIWRPKIEGELVKQYYSRDEIKEAFNTHNEAFRKALAKVASDEVVILNRQPSLHRHSLQGFKPQISWNAKGKNNLAIGLNPLVTTGFNADFDGDTMSVHVPITEAAKQEAIEKLMPSKNLLNPTSNSLIMELKHEMILGLFYMTRDRMPENGYKEFKDVAAVQKAYNLGDIKTYDGVSVTIPSKGVVRATAGKVLFNAPLPPAFMDFDKNINMKQKDVEKILLRIIEDPKYGPMKAVQVMNAWKDIGFNAATKSAVSIGVKDFAPVTKIDTKSLFAEAERAPSVAQYIENLDAFETEKSKFVANRVKQLIQEEQILGADNPVEIMRASGARGNAGQIQAMGVMIGHGRKVDESNIRPVKSSLIQGLSPDEFWDLSNDSRKGIYDRSVASQEPGALTRQLWMANKQTIITEKDCGDTKGIVLNMNVEYERKGLYGRILLEDVRLKDNKGIIKAKKGVPLTRQEVEKIRTDAADPTHIRVRSSLACKAKIGICQYCYGARPGSVSNDLVPIGEAIGSIAAQGIGEPSQQAIMKTFHVGSGQNQVGSGFAMIKDALMQKDTTEGEQYAVVATKDGTVKRIDTDPIKGTIIVTDSGKYNIGKKPKANDIIVGAIIKAGDSLTDLNKTSLRTADVLKYKGVDAAKAQLTSQLTHAFEAGDTAFIDRRHAEVVVENMLGKSVVEDGQGSPFAPGQVVNTKILENYNGQKEVDIKLSYANRMSVIGSKSARDYRTKFGTKIVSKGQVITEDIWYKLAEGGRNSIKIIPNKVSFTPTLTAIDKGTKGSNTNWLESAAYNDVRKALTTGAGNYEVDRLDNPLTRQMTGLKGNFGSGFEEWYGDLNKKFGELFL